MASLLKYHKLGTFIGEEAGATYTCNDASHDTYLKHSGYRLQSARATFAAAVYGFPQDQGIMPDYEVRPTVQDIIDNRDVVLDFAMRIIGEDE